MPRTASLDMRARSDLARNCGQIPEAASKATITEREERPSIAIGTNLPFSEWGTVFPDARLVAIVDRVTFNAHIVETGTQSYRLATSKTSARRKPMA